MAAASSAIKMQQRRAATEGRPNNYSAGRATPDAQVLSLFWQTLDGSSVE